MPRAFRPPSARVAGFGSARKGREHWIAHRVSAIAVIPLGVWFAVSLIAHAGSDYSELVSWVKAPPTTLCLVLLLAAAFHHAALGLQVVIEDYAGSKSKYAALIAVRLLCYALAVGGSLAVLRVAFGR